MRLKVVFDDGLPMARWGPLFHVLRLERPDLRLVWRPVGFPRAGRPLLDNADVGLYLAPPQDPGVDALTLDTSGMSVLLPAGHRLAQYEPLAVADVLDETFLAGPDLRPEWTAFWTLDQYRSGPPKSTTGRVNGATDGIEIVASGRAIATVPDWTAGTLTHPGVVALPLSDGPPVVTQLVWHAGDENPDVRALVELAAAWRR
jgi:DNA-binding transcriptional LysR family regulator